MLGIYSSANPAVEARPAPVARAFDVSVFDRVVMDVGEVALKVIFVLQRMFPVPRLPDAAPPFAPACIAEFRIAPPPQLLKRRSVGHVAAHTLAPVSASGTA